ncbi:MAG: hypothetical protein JW919_01380 [Candidatus Omnitrophica bacterium]|nr:hypothetical protein [Candidatus Omnitrophota bacterium]
MEKKDGKQAGRPEDLSRKRFLTGAAIFFTGQAIPFLIPVMLVMDMPGNFKTAASVILFFVIPSMFTFCAILVLGKPGFGYLKGLIVRWFRNIRGQIPR